MVNEDLVKELESKFSELKKELGFKSSFEEVDRYFLIKDLVLEKGYVSDDLSNQLRVRIIDVLISWDNYLHSLVMPNPQNLFNLNEAKAFNEDEKKDIMKMMSRVAHFVSKNGLVRLTRDKNSEKKIIDDALAFWKDVYEPFFIKVMKKIEEHWQEIEEEK